MIYGYARVSTDGQSVDAQVRQLRAAGARQVFREVASGAKTDRSQLRRALDQLDADDVLMVTRLDRLARSTRDLLNTLASIAAKGAGFRSLGDTWADTTTAHGRLMLTVLGGLAEFERELIRARTGEGRKRAIAKGVKMGRPPKMTPHQIKEALRRRDAGEPMREIARSYNVSTARFRGYKNMAENSSIEWTDTTWNPVTGCTKIVLVAITAMPHGFQSAFAACRGIHSKSGFDLTLRPERLKQPLEWKRPRMIFVNSMSDLFHKDIPKAHITAVFDTMEKANWHAYQVLTKRSSLMQKFLNERYRTRKAPAHMWFGVSVENEQATSRISHLQKANAGVRFLSIEPLIAPVGQLDLSGIDWVIVGEKVEMVHDR